MRSFLTGFVVSGAILFSQQLPPPDGTKQQYKPDGKQAPANNSPTPTPSPFAPNSSEINKPTTNKQTQGSEQQPQGIWEKAFGPETWPNWALTALGVIGGIFALRTLRAVEQQAHANQISAEAAKKSADVSERALIATQRAMLVPTVFDTGTVTREGEGVVGFAVIPVFNNSGHTPALGAECTVDKQVRDINELTHDVPVSPEGLDQLARSVMTVGPGVPSKGLPILISRQEIERLVRNEIAIFVHARVVYRDVFDGTPTHKTSICVRVTVFADPRNQIDGTYNSNQFFFQGGHPDHNYAD